MAARCSLSMLFLAGLGKRPTARPWKTVTWQLAWCFSSSLVFLKSSRWCVR